MIEKININDLWAKEWENAYKFFNSKGTLTTKSKLKNKWYNEFKKMLIKVAKCDGYMREGETLKVEEEDD